MNELLNKQELTLQPFLLSFWPMARCLDVSQVLPSGRFLPFWERLSSVVDFFNSEEPRKQIVLFADAPLTVKVEALPEPQHGFEAGDGA